MAPKKKSSVASTGSKKRSSSKKKKSKPKPTDAMPFPMEMHPNLYSAAYTERLRAKYLSRYHEISECLLASRREVVSKFAESTGADVNAVSDDMFPSLQAGYVARAMGLNITNEQVVLLVSLLEDQEGSTGYVHREKLGGVIADALLTGQIGAPSVVQLGLVDAARLPETPSPCYRADEGEIFRAFSALDPTGRGFIEEAELREAFSSMGEAFAADEMEEMLLAMVDPETGRINYRDFSDVLATE